MKKAFLILFVSVFVFSCAKQKISAPLPSQIDQPASTTTETKSPNATAKQEEAKLEQLDGLKTLTPQDITPDMIVKAQTTASDEFSEKSVLKKMIHFDFDSYEINNDAKKILEEIAAYLKEYRSLKIIVEGHCDERGTKEYNLALGMKRAEATKKYLEDLGIEESRLSIISYGEDKPLDPTSSEEAWAKNRRAQFKRAQ